MTSEVDNSRILFRLYDSKIHVNGPVPFARCDREIDQEFMKKKFPTWSFNDFIVNRENYRFPVLKDNEFLVVRVALLYEKVEKVVRGLFAFFDSSQSLSDEKIKEKLRSSFKHFPEPCSLQYYVLSVDQGEIDSASLRHA